MEKGGIGPARALAVDGIVDMLRMLVVLAATRSHIALSPSACDQILLSASSAVRARRVWPCGRVVV